MVCATLRLGRSRSAGTPLLIAVVLGGLLAGPLPEAGALVPTPAALVPAVAFAGSPSCCTPAAARAPRGGWSVAAPSAAGLAARRVGRKSTEMSCEIGDRREPEKDGQKLAGVWTEEITGDEKFDTAWMAAWQNKDRIPCPFFKRRATDVLEAALAVGRFVLARHKSLLLFAPRSSKGGAKVMGLAPEAVLEVIRSDFEDRRYYITGQLTREVYSDACFFDAPDPDMPVTGLEKYISAISNLFEKRASDLQLLDMQMLAPDLLLSRWRLEATLKLPWRPKIKAYTGVTLYELDHQGLICRHTELWSISAADAFVSAVFPERLGAAPPAPPAAVLMQMPPHRRSPDPYPLLRAAAARRRKVPAWSFFGGRRLSLNGAALVGGGVERGGGGNQA